MSYVPARDSNFIFDKKLLQKALIWLSPAAPRRGFLIAGNAGSGKTSFFKQIAAVKSIEVFEVAGSPSLSYDSLVGTQTLQDGNIQWQDGPLTMAWRRGGIFLINEVTRMSADEQMRLVNQLDRHGSLFIEQTGEQVPMHANFRIAATGNSGMFGDESGAYPGERKASYAFRDRFIVAEYEGLNAEQETNLIVKHSGIAPDLASRMVSFAGHIRSQFCGGGGSLELSVTPRGMMDWAATTQLYSQYFNSTGIPLDHNGGPVLEALRDIVLNGAPKDQRETIESIWLNWMTA